MLPIKRKLFKPVDIIAAAAVILCVIFIFVKSSSDTRTAVITVDGKTVKTINLDNAENEIFSLDEVPDVTVEIKNGEIAFVNAKCHDKTCEKSGFLHFAGETAACLPNKTVITVTGENNKYDGVSF